MPSQTATLPGLPARVVVTTGDQTLAQIQKKIDDDVALAIRSLTNRLRRIYAAEVRGKEAELMAPLKELAGLAVEEAFAEVSMRFEAYAAARGPILPQLSLLLNGTDYYKPLEPPLSDSKVVLQRFSRALELQKQLKALDAEFKEEISRLLAEADRKVRAREDELRAAFAKLLLDAEDRATRDAQSDVAKRRKDLKLEPKGQIRLNLPAVAPERRTLAGGNPIPVPPDPRDRAWTGITDREALESELRIWLAANGYKLSRGARDATKEFQEWRSRRHAGL